MSRKSCCVPIEWEREIDRVLEGYRNETYVCEVVSTGQPKHMSGAEALTNTVVGYIVAVSAQMVVYPSLGIEVSLHQNLTIAAIITCISIVRSYVLRRVFNWIHCHASRY